MTLLDAVVIGAGQAGLATAHVLRRHGLDPLLLEAGPSPTGSWSRYYDSLTLFSPARFSELPGLRFPGDPERYPTRDEVVAYLAAYAEGLDVPIEVNTRAVAVTRTAQGFVTRAGDGREFTSRLVISASGGFGAPYRPALPGLDGFAGTVLHSADYRAPEPFAGKRVVVMGAGNSAVQIAVELAEVAAVTLASRGPVRFMPQRPLGRDLHEWLHRSGLERLPLGRLLRGRTVRVLDDGRYRAAIEAGRPDWRPMFARLTPDAVAWADGMVEPVDVVLLATGFRPQVAHLAGCAGRDGRSALDGTGYPVHDRGASITVPGLGFVGLEGQRGIASATLRGVGRDAAHVVQRLTADVRRMAAVGAA
ncbi:flavin-containing monooxygenase [Couchioplanes caeruleus]|uniref:FAD-dependent oxidoreductase n=2 Tax=Couchioplanes caeruleus TaxID=56438 RepID=A0A1K0G4H5_9ACTN|nr:NAD(P)/FAD-dependent oxidoreductase [Couchioplanes caeruleus]OJF12186.1 FAD-dependent oxidoreductase [Couchioplanes caeruleus subsp. caeruleus]